MYAANSAEHWFTEVHRAVHSATGSHPVTSGRDTASERTEGEGGRRQGQGPGQGPFVPCEQPRRQELFTSFRFLPHPIKLPV